LKVFPILCGLLLASFRFSWFLFLFYSLYKCLLVLQCSGVLGVVKYTFKGNAEQALTIDLIDLAICIVLCNKQQIKMKFNKSLLNNVFLTELNYILFYEASRVGPVWIVQKSRFAQCCCQIWFFFGINQQLGKNGVWLWFFFEIF
jgi:hypothetical protein